MSCSVKIAVVGSGYWGKNLVRNFNNIGVLHSICDTNKEVLAGFAKQYPNVNGITDFADIVADPEITGVALATPAPSHASLAMEAMLAGKDVYVEKPLCLSEADGRELNLLARAEGRVLMVGHLLWYHPVVLRIKEMVENGELGRINYIYSNRLNLGKLRREENVLWSFAPHDISVILGLVGEMPDSVSGQGSNFLHKDISDITMVNLNFPSGVNAHILVSWLNPFKEQKLVVVGEKKMIVFDDVAPWEEKLQVYPHIINWQNNIPVAEKAEVEFLQVAEEEPLRAECEHFVSCIESRNTPRTDGEEGLRVLKVLNGCQSAIDKGKEFVFSDEVESDDLFVHESSEIDKSSSVGKGTKIWHFSRVLSGCVIGDNCSFGQNVVVGPNVTIGHGCKIQNNVSLYEGVKLGNNVFCGPSMVFTNVMNPRAEVSRKKEFYSTNVADGVTFGANCTIVGNITIGEYAFIGAGSVVLSDVPAYALIVGNPARQIGWMSRYGERIDLPLEGNNLEYQCPHTGDLYVLHKNNLTLEENNVL